MLAKNKSTITTMVGLRYNAIRALELSAYQKEMASCVPKFQDLEEVKDAKAMLSKVLGENVANWAFQEERIRNGFRPAPSLDGVGKSSLAYRWLDALGYDPWAIRFPIPELTKQPWWSELDLALNTASDTWKNLQEPIINLGYDLSLSTDVNEVGKAVVAFLKVIK